MTALHWIVALVALQRVVELIHAERNSRRLLARGGVETGRAHYPAIVAVHAAWLVSLIAFVPSQAPVNWWLLALYGLLQCGRLWTIFSLGERWTTRVIHVPGAPLVRRGPYRRLRHPNYVIVAAEIALLPLVFGAWEIAVVFSLLNGAILVHRIRVEEEALGLRTVSAGRSSRTPDA